MLSSHLSPFGRQAPRRSLKHGFLHSWLSRELGILTRRWGSIITAVELWTREINRKQNQGLREKVLLLSTSYW